MEDKYISLYRQSHNTVRVEANFRKIVMLIPNACLTVEPKPDGYGYIEIEQGGKRIRVYCEFDCLIDAMDKAGMTYVKMEGLKNE